MINRVDFLEIINAKKKRQAEKETAKEQIAPATLQHLTGTASWDEFIKLLGQKLIELERSRAVINQQLAAEPFFNHDALLSLKVQAMLLEERAITIKEILELPKSLGV